MTPLELFEIIAEYYNYDEEMIILKTNELLALINEEPRDFIYRLAREVEYFASDHVKCPCCGKDLVPAIDCWECSNDDCNYAEDI